MFINYKLCFSIIRKSFAIPQFTRLSHISTYNVTSQDYKQNLKDDCNFARDIIDKWSENEKRLALWWTDLKGNEKKFTFKDIANQSNRTANFLIKDCNLKRFDRIIIILPRVYEWWIFNIACIRTGCVLIPGTSLLSEKDILHRLNTSKATCIITNAKTAKKVDNIAESCKTLKCKILIKNEFENESFSNYIANDWIDFHSKLNNHNDNFQTINSQKTDPLTIFFTSGTTGNPKMVRHNYSYPFSLEVVGKYWLDLQSENYQDSLMWNISDTGWAKSAWSSLYAPWLQGCGIFTQHFNNFMADIAIKNLEKYPITTLCAPPTAYRMLVQVPNLNKRNFNHLRHCVSAGEPLNPQVIKKWRDATGLEIRDGYGQSETSLLAGSFKWIENKAGSMGKAAPGIDLKILDNDMKKEVGLNEEGILAVKIKPNRPLGLFTEYVDDEKTTSASFQNNYYITGDKAYKDINDYFWFVSRSDDVIISAGYRIGPFEVESALIEHDAVAESAVVGTPDKLRGQTVKAFIVLTEDFKKKKNINKLQLIHDLQNHVKQLTAPYKYPRKIEFVDQLPKTVSGKIRRVDLRKLEEGRKF